MKKKAFVLFSGGLDSMLAVRVLENQGFLVTGICFESNFYNANKARDIAKQIRIEFIVVDIRKEMLDLVKKPPHGLGKNMNPCIDCHGLMLKKVGEIIATSLSLREGANATTWQSHEKIRNDIVIATGEVLGQRPFSQNKQALEIVKKISGIDVLRPLSAKLLPETEIEKNKIIDREKLFSIKGRRREGQKELLEKFKIKEYPSPSGGCLLTDPVFSQRIKQMLENWQDCTVDDIELIKYGRVFWAKVKGEMFLFVIGRHKEDNENLEKLAKKYDIMVELKEEKGPVTLARRIRFAPPAGGWRKDFRFKNDYKIEIPVELSLEKLELNQEKSEEEFIKIVAKMTGYFSPKLRGREIEFIIRVCHQTTV
ncbi:tRNA 4-thiouridine(8) synthase ThiI [Candidatus Parcubacteria bacterium]|nr:tRNA 4-thiouridine(8) synthase ThiI [Candidatus Parcubacteria bacterium]